MNPEFTAWKEFWWCRSDHSPSLHLVLKWCSVSIKRGSKTSFAIRAPCFISRCLQFNQGKLQEVHRSAVEGSPFETHSQSVVHDEEQCRSHHRHEEGRGRQQHQQEWDQHPGYTYWVDQPWEGLDQLEQHGLLFKWINSFIIKINVSWNYLIC